jgi:rhodanese-related sulfurtransferase
MKILSLLLLFAFSSNAYSGKVETPKSLEKVKIVTPQDAKKMQDSGAILYDVRKKVQSASERIKGAIILPYKEKSAKKADFDDSKDKFKTEKITNNKSTNVIFYCNGPTCWKSYKASKAASKAGYTNVFWLREGIPGWKKSGLPTEK